MALFQHSLQRNFYKMKQYLRTRKLKVCYIILGVLTLAALYYLNTLRYFTVLLEPDERAVMLKMLKIIDTKFTAAGITYMIMDGTLLGSYRNHGFIPWDDDVDLWVGVHDVKRITEVLAEAEPEFQVYRQANGAMSWRFHPANTQYPKSTFPFIDIQFYLENGTHMWPIQTYKESLFHKLKSKMLPTRRRPFENLMLPAPCDVSYVVSAHNPDICLRRAYFHKLEKPEEIWKASIWPCSVIKRWFPSVERVRIDGGWNESLIYDGKVLKTFIQKDCSNN